MAKDLKDADLQSLADVFSKLPPPARTGAPDPAKVKRGRVILEKDRCTGCHGRDLAGEKNVPRIANQREDYLLKALRDYKSGKRIGYGNAIMPETVSGLSDADLVDVAHAIAYFVN